tara:strand:- start:75 stop:317 length:243 start_codon:yes stop_codon:yes gene_type:complete
MDYYILMPGDNKEEAQYDSNHLGTRSFDIFWAGQGLKILMKMVEQDPEMLTQIVIKTDKNENITVTDFLDAINKLQVRIN